MSYADLRPWFPSASHPALPAANSILSTLRHLTGPGKGNDLKPEERAALVGVSALLGCEKVQNKDLVERTAQKASSVAPAHFRAALKRARVLLAEADAQAGQSDNIPRRRSTRGESSASVTSPSSVSAGNKTPAAAGRPTPSVPTIEVDPLSPYQTPKKRFKYSSGVDLSGLIRNSPTKGSPLKQSVTPSKTPARQLRSEGRAALAEEVEGAEDDVLEDPLGAQGTEMEVAADHDQAPARSAVPPSANASRSTAAAAISAKRRKEDVSAFLALRPGSVPSATTPSKRDVGVVPDMEFDDAIRAKVRRTGPRTQREKRTVRRKRDWTYRETKWTDADLMARHADVLVRLEGALGDGEDRTREMGTVESL